MASREDDIANGASVGQRGIEQGREREKKVEDIKVTTTNQDNQEINDDLKNSDPVVNNELKDLESKQKGAENPNDKKYNGLVDMDFIDRTVLIYAENQEGDPDPLRSALEVSGESRIKLGNDSTYPSQNPNYTNEEKMQDFNRMVAAETLVVGRLAKGEETEAEKKVFVNGQFDKDRFDEFAKELMTDPEMKKASRYVIEGKNLEQMVKDGDEKAIAMTAWELRASRIIDREKLPALKERMLLDSGGRYDGVNQPKLPSATKKSKAEINGGTAKEKEKEDKQKQKAKSPVRSAPVMTR